MFTGGIKGSQETITSTPPLLEHLCLGQVFGARRGYLVLSTQRAVKGKRVLCACAPGSHTLLPLGGHFLPQM